MGAQIILCDGFEVVPPPEMSDLIYFGSDQSMSNSDESTVTTEEDGTVFSGDSSLGDAAEEEWLEEKPFSFYIVKQHAYDDPEIKAKISEADQEIYLCNKRRIEVASALKAERAEVSSFYAQMESLVSQSEGYRVAFEEKMKEFDTLQESLWNLRCSSSDQLCFSKEELERLIYVAYYQIEYGSIGFEDKDWVLKGTEKPHVTNLSEDALAQKEASIQRVKSMAVELNEVKKKLDAITWKISHFNDQVGSSKKKISDLEGEKVYILEKRDRCYARIKMLRIQRDKGNVAYYKSLAVLRKAKELAASGNVSDLEVFASSEVDGFMSHWNNDKAFRDEYVKRISLSLCKRQLSRDGRIKDPQVHIVREKQALVKTMKGGEEIHKKNRDDSISNSSQDENVTTDKRKKETSENKKTMDSNSAEESDDMEFTVYEIPKKEEEKVDEETLKERKREEQLEKARLAMERKRKLQEKATAKAAIRAQKEAEKKLKECEKKAKKKAAASTSSPSESDQSQEPEVVRTLAAVSGKEKHQKERSLFPKQRSFRYKHRGRGTEALPKVILNRRRAHKYWVWGISSAALAVTLVLVVLLLR